MERDPHRAFALGCTCVDFYEAYVLAFTEFARALGSPELADRVRDFAAIQISALRWVIEQ